MQRRGWHRYRDHLRSRPERPLSARSITRTPRGVRTLTAALVLAVALAASGCSGGDDDSPGTELTTLDFRFQPAEFLATAGQQVTLTVVNEGKATHNFSIPSIFVDVDLEPGKRQNVIFVPTEPGTLEFICTFHVDQGMKGTFRVQA